MSEVQQEQEQTLKRGLKQTHTAYRIGWCCGYGAVSGNSHNDSDGGAFCPARLCSRGFIAFLIMRQLGEMVAEEPVTGHSAILPINTGVVLPVLSGWNYWAMFVLVGMAELTAVGEYIKFWWDVPTWVSAAIFSC